jgi:hypothetical protein
LYFCSSTNTWTQMSGGGSSTVTENTYIPFAGQYTTGTAGTTGGGVINSSGNSSSTQPALFHSTGYGIPSYEFAPSSGDADYIYVTWMLHQNWTGSAVNVVLSGMGSSGSGNAYLKVATWCTTNSALSSPSFNTDTTGTMASSGSYIPAQLTLSGLNMTGCSAGNVIVFRVGRDRSNSSDTLGSSAIYLLGVQIQWQHN